MGWDFSSVPTLCVERMYADGPRRRGDAERRRQCVPTQSVGPVRLVIEWHHPSNIAYFTLFVSADKWIACLLGIAYSVMLHLGPPLDRNQRIFLL